MYKALEKCPLFRGLTAEQIEKIIDERGDYTLTNFKAEECIAQRDTAYSGLMIIISGSVRGEITYASGRTVRVEALGASELIAPAFLFGGYNRLPVDIIAETDVTIMMLHRGYIFELMQSDMLILSNFIDIISNRASLWAKKIYLLSFRMLKDKAIRYLLDNTSAEEATLPVPDAAAITANFDTTRSALVAVLDELERRHLIRMSGERIEIVNRQGLEDILE